MASATNEALIPTTSAGLSTILMEPAEHAIERLERRQKQMYIVAAGLLLGGYPLLMIQAGSATTASLLWQSAIIVGGCALFYRRFTTFLGAERKVLCERNQKYLAGPEADKRKVLVIRK